MKRFLLLILLLGPLPFLTGCSAAPGGTGAAPTGPAPDYRKSNAEVVVLNFFDMYCHSCQTMAPHSKKLHQMVQQRGYGSRVEFFAIGWGNTPLESEQYRQRFGIPYPVMPDRDLSISKRFGSFRPPLMIVLERRQGSLAEKARIEDLRGDKESIFNRIVP